MDSWTWEGILYLVLQIQFWPRELSQQNGSYWVYLFKQWKIALQCRSSWIDGFGTKTLLVLLQRTSNSRSSRPTPDKARLKTLVLLCLSVPLLSGDYVGLEGKKNKHPVNEICPRSHNQWQPPLCWTPFCLKWSIKIFWLSQIIDPRRPQTRRDQMLLPKLSFSKHF